MANYNKSVNFAVKDTLQAGDPQKIVSGAEIDTEFNNISSSSTTKIDKVSSATTGNVPQFTATGSIEDSGENPTSLGSPSGSVIAFAGTSAPDGWYLCQGQEISRATNSSLFSAIGTTFGSGDGSTTFNLPDLRGEFLRAWDDGRGVDAGRGIGTGQPSTIVYGAAQQPGAGFGNSFYDADLIPALEEDGVSPQLTGTNAYQTRGTGGSAGWARAGRTVRPRNQALLACIKF